MQVNYYKWSDNIILYQLSKCYPCIITITGGKSNSNTVAKLFTFDEYSNSN